MPAILQRYLVFECFRYCLLALVVLLAVVLALFSSELLNDIAQGRVLPSIFGQLLLLRLPEAALLIGPLALLAGLLLALGQLGQDHELSVLRASGLAPGSVFASLSLLAAGWALALLLVSGWLAPWAASRSAELIAEAQREGLLAGLRAGQFERVGQGALSVYVGALGADGVSVERVFIHHVGPQGPEVVTARHGRLWVDEVSGARYLALMDGEQIRHAAGGLPLTRIEFARNDVRLPTIAASIEVDELAQLPLEQLRRHTSPAAHRHWHWRVAPVVASLLLAALAVPMALRDPRAGRSGGALAAVGIYLVYINGAHLGLSWLERTGASSGPGLWPLHVAVALIALGFWWRLSVRW